MIDPFSSTAAAPVMNCGGAEGEVGSEASAKFRAWMGIVLVGMERAFNAAMDFESIDEVLLPLLSLSPLPLPLPLDGGRTNRTLK